jgi:hypothetical protein
MLFYCAIYECFYNTVLTVSRKKGGKAIARNHQYTTSAGCYPSKFEKYNLLKGFSVGCKEHSFPGILPLVKAE